MRKSRLTPSQWIEIGIWTALVALFFGASFYYDKGFSVFKYGTAAWPRVLLVLMALAIVGQVAEYLAHAQGDKSRRDQSASFGALLRRLKKLDPTLAARTLGAFAIPMLYVLLLSGAGFFVLTPLFIAAYLVNAGEKRFWPVVLTSLGVFAVLTVVFTRYLYVGLPLGNWPGFHAVGAAITNFLAPK